MKKLKEIMMVAAVAAAMVISVPVYASENDKFSDGGIAEQMEVFPAGELTGDAFDDGTEIISEVFSSYFGGKPSTFENEFIKFIEGSERYDGK